MRSQLVTIAYHTSLMMGHHVMVSEAIFPETKWPVGLWSWDPCLCLRTATAALASSKFRHLVGSRNPEDFVPFFVALLSLPAWCTSGWGEPSQGRLPSQVLSKRKACPNPSSLPLSIPKSQPGVDPDLSVLQGFGYNLTGHNFTWQMSANTPQILQGAKYWTCLETLEGLDAMISRTEWNPSSMVWHYVMIVFFVIVRPVTPWLIKADLNVDRVLNFRKYLLRA